MERLHAIITGQVQGVGFRFYVKRHADVLGLTGYVRNLPEGQVEVVAEGNPGELDQLTRLLEIGPSGAVVYNVAVDRGHVTGGYPEFIIAAG